ncbi:ABC transporter substrate-binding protein [Arthrobacter sp. MA-N2]|uniref:ABC transporter substrate-binding protein n=1 Tax=Arthrobacter sp. MA-N2 TaxID=1101188 RepID=UPI0004B5AC13|nr:ABC transporter substrate-binding protein [Arthrobacter sp. MA-N2]
MKLSSITTVPLNRRRLLLTASAAIVALGLSACSAAASTPTGAGASTPITIGLIPIIDVAPVQLGVQQGFFKDQGLTPTIESAATGAAIVPAVVSGQYQFGFSNGVSLLVAASKGIPVQIIASGVSTVGGGPAVEPEGVVVRNDSAIKSAKDLSGKTIAVAVRNSLTDTAVSAAVKNDGGDPTTIRYVEIPLADIPAVVQRGEADAGEVVEPFLAQSKNLGLRSVASSFASATSNPNLTVSYYFTSKDFAQQHPDVVQKFVTALDKSKAYAQGNSDAVRKILPTYTKIDAATGPKLNLPKWTAGLDRGSLELLGDLAYNGKLLTAKPNVAGLLP